MPGYPDNLSYNGQGLFWVAPAAPRVDALDRLAGRPWLRTVLFRLPAAFTRVIPPPVAWVLGVDAEAQVRHHLREVAGGYTNIASVQEVNGELWLGSLFGRSVADGVNGVNAPPHGAIIGLARRGEGLRGAPLPSRIVKRGMRDAVGRPRHDAHHRPDC